MYNIKKLPKEERPRERLFKYGSTSLSNEELLSIILKSGNKKYNLKEIVNNLLQSLNSITDLRKKSLPSLVNIAGMSQIKACELLAVVELGKRVWQDTSLDNLIACTDPITIISYFHHLFQDKDQEEFYVLYLDTQKQYITHKKLFVGSASASLVHPREIFKEAYLNSASYLICLHNHPSGNVTPSKEDISVTQKINDIGLLHDIYLLDHIIIGHDQYFSFYENKMIICQK